MNRQRFLAELSQLLAFMTPHDRNAKLKELNQRFDEAGLEGEGAIIASLGTPTALAIRLAREYVPSPAPSADTEPNETAGKPEAAPSAEPAAEQASIEKAGTDIAPDAKSIKTAPESEPENISEEKAKVDTEPSEAVKKSDNGETEDGSGETTPDNEAESPDAEKPDVADTLIEDIPPEAKISSGSKRSMSSVPEAQRVLSPQISALFGIDSSTPKIENDDDDDEERTPNGRAALNLLTACGGLVLLCVTLIMCAVLFAPGAFFGGVTFLSVIAGIWAAPVFADALYLYGIAIMALALTVLLLFLAVWAVVCMLKPLIQDIKWLYHLTGGERE